MKVAGVNHVFYAGQTCEKKGLYGKSCARCATQPFLRFAGQMLTNCGSLLVLAADKYANTGSSQANSINKAIIEGYSVCCRHTVSSKLPCGHDHELVYTETVLEEIEKELLMRFDYAFNERKQVGHPWRRLIVPTNGTAQDLGSP